MGFMLTANETDQPPSTGMAPDFYDQPPFETGVESNDGTIMHQQKAIMMRYSHHHIHPHSIQHNLQSQGRDERLHQQQSLVAHHHQQQLETPSADSDCTTGLMRGVLDN